MGCYVQCDNCKKTQTVIISPDKVFRKPHEWFGAGEQEDFELVCSLKCADELDAKKGAR